MGRFRSWRGHDAGAIYVLVRRRCEETLGREVAAQARERGLAMDEVEAFAFAEARLS